MSQVHANTPNTLEVERLRLTTTEANGEEKETSVDSKIILAPHIEENKESNKVEPSATIVVSSTYVQAPSSGRTPSPSKRRTIKDVSPDIEVSLDEIIKVP